jgi:hypothetical protein
MSQSTVIPNLRSFQEYQPDEWIPILAQFTRENRGAHARLEIIGGDIRYQVETENWSGPKF